jgi:predicted RNase H-like nuclease
MEALKGCGKDGVQPRGVILKNIASSETLIIVKNGGIPYNQIHQISLYVKFRYTGDLKSPLQWELSQKKHKEGVIMKTHKIRNVEKDVCCAEEMIAYNLSFRAHISYGDKFRGYINEKEPIEIEICNTVSEIRDRLIEDYRRDGSKKYNIDAIFVALNSGLRAYLTKPFIATEYLQVGETFKIQ